MDSGSIFGGYYGFVRGGIWRITEELGALNTELGVDTRLSSRLIEVDPGNGEARYEQGGREHKVEFDAIVLGTDPLTAARLVGDDGEIRQTESLRFRGSSGKLNLLFKKPVRWKHGSDHPDSDAAFRFIFSVSSVDAFEASTLAVMDTEVDYSPGFMQVYCEGAAMRRLDQAEPFDRLAVFFKNLSLGETGAELDDVERQVAGTLFDYVENPEDCVWTRLLMPKDLQQIFLFPGGNLDHTMLTGGQTFFDRTFSDDPATDFYRFGGMDNVYLCGAGTYPCGSVTGTPGYMCSQQLLRKLGSDVSSVD